MIRNDQEDFFKKWEELSSVMNRAKKIMSRIEYLKEDNEFCRDMYEYKDPVSQICTIS
jgi:conjugal transfer/entry exclusion protein